MGHTDNAGCVKVIRPSSSGTETKFVFAAMLLTLVVCASSIALRHISKKEYSLPDWQINAFDSLNPQELAVYNGLVSAGAEIDAIHADDNNRWPTVAELEEDFIPPFTKDSGWEKDGRIFWQRKILDSGYSHLALYRGISKESDKIRGTFLLAMIHDHVKKQGNAVSDAQAELDSFKIDSYETTPQPAEKKFPAMTTGMEEMDSEQPHVHPQGGHKVKQGHAPYEIWFHAANDKSFPTIITDQALINAGWKEIVSRSGEDEMKRTKGEEFN
ncbi:DUF6162 family protein [Desulfovibrio sp. JC010]|uniref:DUF6162 family protein n=1 Tax=Desulfovibrio sp. JC010 TaxID=2593641 RepID=UPI0013D27066|nr:hypothetical protein [Desulfovibrio sp. JC010]NDV28552.1 hypothetical protein [Desulfovibrio sp. JC010]